MKTWDFLVVVQPHDSQMHGRAAAVKMQPFSLKVRRDCCTLARTFNSTGRTWCRRHPSGHLHKNPRRTRRHRAAFREHPAEKTQLNATFCATALVYNLLLSCWHHSTACMVYVLTRHGRKNPALWKTGMLQSWTRFNFKMATSIEKRRILFVTWALIYRNVSS